MTVTTVAPSRRRWEDFRAPEVYFQDFADPNSTALISAEQIVGKVENLFGRYEEERDRLSVIDMWYKGEQPRQSFPGETPELRDLLDLARTPWLGLVVTTVAQAMYVDGYKQSGSKETLNGPWRTWNANRFPSQQIAIHRAALGYGYAFVVVEAGKDRYTGKPQAVMSGVSPQRMYAEYADPAADEWPLYALKVNKQQNDACAVYLYDDTFKHTLTLNAKDSKPKWELLSSVPHGAPCVPVVRYTNSLDLNGNTPGEVEPFIGVAARIDKTMFDRMLVQHFNSWKKLVVTGLIQSSNEDAMRKKMQLRQDDAIVFEDPEVKVQVLDQTDLDGFLASVEADVEHLAAVSQLPNHLLTGKMVNLSADALASARAPLTQKVFERQVSFGESHAQALRLASLLQGDESSAQDVLAHVTWQDMEIRSLAQAADALGKMATQLGIPKQALWGKVPGVTQSEVDEWASMAMDDDPLTKYLREKDEKSAAGEKPKGDERDRGKPQNNEKGGDE